MAITQNPFIGRSSGRVANVILQTWKGKNVMRSKPLNVANPKTALQTAQRQKMKFLSQMSSQLGALLKSSFKEVSINRTEYNSFVKENFPLLVNNAGIVNFNPPQNIKVSSGSLPQLANFSVTSNTNTSATMEWSYNAGAIGVLPTDKVHVVCYDSAEKKFFVSPDSFDLSNGMGVFNFTNGNISGVQHVYGIVIRNTEGKASDSVHTLL